LLLSRHGDAGAVRFPIDIVIASGVQLFDRVAVSTYRNVVQVTDADGKAATLRMSWASVYLKEAGDWKIGAVHLIDKQ
jgi:hypothetical protein